MGVDEGNLQVIYTDTIMENFPLDYTYGTYILRTYYK